MGGYQSSTNLDDLIFVGDFPIENSLGGYGQTSGAGNDYELTLNPPITQYRVGMMLQVMFDHANTGSATLNVNGQGAIPITKIVGDTLDPLETNDLNTTNIYNLVYDGTNFQVVTGQISGISAASEGQSGIAEIATQAETDAGVDDDRIVTALKLATLLNNRNATETLTGLAEIATQIEVNDGVNDDRIVTALKLTTLLNNRNANEDRTGLTEIATQAEVDAGVDNDRTVTALKLATLLNNRNATETLTGLAEIATQAEANAGTDDTRIITAFKLAGLLNNRNATEGQTGLAEIATQTEANMGVDDTRIITALKLATLLNSRNATEVLTGLAEIATQAEVDNETDDTRFVTPLKLGIRLGALLAGYELALGNPLADGHILQSTAAGVRSWRPINSRLFTDYVTVTAGGDTNENTLGNSYNMPAGTLSGDQTLEINISGNIQSGAGVKTFRVYVGNELIFTYGDNSQGAWSIRIIAGRVNTDILKGEASITHAGFDTGVEIVETSGLQMDTVAQNIRLTYQNNNAGAVVNRFSFIVRRIV